jgi:HEPN domain-containing protein
MDNWREQLDHEFEGAALARAGNNEGRARVCARRAAGIAIRETLARRGQRPRSTSAIDLLNHLKEEMGLPPALKPNVDHLTLHVTEEFKLPVEADLIAEARELCEWLLPDWK